MRETARPRATKELHTISVTTQAYSRAPDDGHISARNMLSRL